MEFSRAKLLVAAAAASVVMSAATSQAAKVEVIAHRGFSYVAPENTLPAMREAYKTGADGVELDIHLTADRKVILSHDETTSRTTGGKTSLVIAETSASVLQKLDVGKWKNAKFAGEPMPLLDEMLAELPEGVRAFVEFKSGGDGAVEVRNVVEKSGKRGQITFISFGLDTITAVKKTMPDRPAYWLRGTEKDKETGKVIPHGPDLIRQAKERGLDGLDLGYAGITAEFVKEAKAAGLEVHAWTVNYADEAARLRDIGVDSITTDRPDMVLEVVRGKKQ